MIASEEVANAADEFILRQIGIAVKQKAPNAEPEVVKALTTVYYNEVIDNLARRHGLTVYP